MLESLSIRDIVLIERLDINFNDGLCVLTGETGAGKSILLDSLGLATGARAGASLVRKGAARAMVIAEFSLPVRHPARTILAEHDLDFEDDERLILRRTVSADGKSRAFVNDQPASVGLLKRLGDGLIEVHGQHDDRGLLDPSGHRDLVDAYGDNGDALATVETTSEALREAMDRLARAIEEVEAARRDEEYDRHALEELDRLTPGAGEEEELATERQLMMQGEKTSELLENVFEQLGTDGGVDATLRGALRKLERTDEAVRGLLEDVIAGLERAADEAAASIDALTAARRRLEFDPNRLEDTEERLFALRAMARKHSCRVDELPGVRVAVAGRLEALDAGEGSLLELEADVGKCRAAFAKAIKILSERRSKAAKALDTVVNAELGPLKLEKARFRTSVNALDEDAWGAGGGEQVAFEVATLAGADFGALKKIASGGELARFILALKVALAGAGTAPSLIFDEVDRGIGGAVADAVGQRLKMLADEAQVMVVTHSPQVAALGDNHWRVTKFETTTAGETVTLSKITALTPDERREEIARMLSGAQITDEARAAAGSLMQNAG